MVNGGAVWGGDEIYLNQEKAYLRLGMSNGMGGGQRHFWHFWHR